jgi:hypothetical protein
MILLVQNTHMYGQSLFWTVVVISMAAGIFSAIRRGEIRGPHASDVFGIVILLFVVALYVILLYFLSTIRTAWQVYGYVLCVAR